MIDIDRVIAAHQDRTADRDAIAELNQWIKADPANAQRFYLLSILHAGLRDHLGPQQVDPSDAGPVLAAVRAPNRPVAIRSGSNWRLRHSSLAAAAVLVAGTLVGLVGWLLSTEPKGEDVPSGGARFVSVIDSTGDLYVDDGFGHAGGDYGAAAYELTGGSAEFLLSNRVGVNISGETRLFMSSPMLASMQRGSATFHCPPSAKGFTVHLPSGLTVIDLGTRFRVIVAKHGRIDIRVIEGMVEVRSAGGQVRTLTSGQWVWTDRSDALSIARSDELNEATLGYWPFDGHIENRIGPGADGRFEGGAALDPNGRVGGALRLADGASRVAVDPASLQLGGGDLAISLWFTRDADPLTNRRLLSLGAIDDRDPGYAIFAGDLRLVAIMRDGKGKRLLADAAHAGPGVWQHLVVNIDRDDRMTVYLDGQDVASVEIDELVGRDIRSHSPLWIGGARARDLGWTGMIDEVSIYRRTLTEAEIAQLGAAGPPANPNTPESERKIEDPLRTQ